MLSTVKLGMKDASLLLLQASTIPALARSRVQGAGMQEHLLLLMLLHL
jgi:hypothetical protein